MTTVYFIRHCESDTGIRDDYARPLTLKGLLDRELVTDYLEDKGIDLVFSSPYKRAIDTVAHFAEKHQFTMETIDNFRERRVDSQWVDDFISFSKRQWNDFDYKLSGGESLGEVQKRNVSALQNLLTKHSEQNIVIGTHGTALSTIINYYDPSYNFESFMAMVKIMPWIVKMEFEGKHCLNIQTLDLFVTQHNRGVANENV